MAPKRLQLLEEDEVEADASSYDDFLHEFDYLVQNQQHQLDVLPPRVFDDEEEEGTAEDTACPYIITKQPPREVRTSKAKDKRAFACQLKRNTASSEQQQVVRCRVVFADTLEPVPGEEEEDAVLTAGAVVDFTQLQVLSPGLKFDDRDMCLEFTSGGGAGAWRLLSHKFYAYSNVGVLKRRKQVEIAALSSSSSSHKKHRLHVVGKTFFQSPRLSVMFRFFDRDRAWRSLAAHNVELYSDSVLFFDPPGPTGDLAALLGCLCGATNRLFVQVSNDGRNYSNALEYAVYVPVSLSTSSPLHRPMLGFDGGGEDEFQARL